MLEAYARGVNAFIAQKRLPVEYAILETDAARRGSRGIRSRRCGRSAF